MKISGVNVPNWALYAVAAGVVIYVLKKGLKDAVADAAAAVVGAAGNVAAGAVKGSVLGVGDAIGVPRTNLDKCKAAIGSANDFEASQYCSASVFAKWQYLSMKKRMLGVSFTINDLFN